MNPELRRILWLEASVQRLWLIPAAVLGTAVLLHSSNAAPMFMRSLAMFAFIVLTVIWGARQAANAVLDEARDRTWEIQRMSALSPWSMTWGKLLGATAMPWYAGLVCLALFINYHATESLREGVAWALFAALLAIALQAFALTAALVSMHLDRRLRARLNIVIVLFLLSLLLPELATLVIPGAGPFSALDNAVSWNGRSYDGMGFTLVLLAFFAGWAIIGAYRMMCLELEVRTTPWLWLVFIISLAILQSGFDDGTAAPNLLGRWSSSAAAYACALSYIAGFAFARDPIQYRRVLQAMRERRYRRALEEMPLWISSAAYTLVFAVVALGVGADSTISNERIDNLGPAAMAMALMMLRDLCLLTYLSFRQRTRRAEVTALIYLAILNRMLPAMLTLSGLSLIAGLCKPTVFETPTFAIGIGLVHATIAAVLLLSAYRQVMPAVSPSGDRQS